MLFYVFIAVVSYAALATVALVASVLRTSKLLELQDALGERIDESLDILNDCYGRISRIAETPVASDDPLIQQLLNDVKYTKHAILLIANKIVDSMDEDDKEE